MWTFFMWHTAHAGLCEEGNSKTPLVGQGMATELGAPAGLPHCPLCLARLKITNLAANLRCI